MKLERTVNLKKEILITKLSLSLCLSLCYSSNIVSEMMKTSLQNRHNSLGMLLRLFV